jgi:hypothetical protein
VDAATLDQAQTLYDGLRILAKLIVEAYLNEKRETEKSSITNKINTSAISQLQAEEKLLLSVTETSKLLGIAEV